MPVTHNATLVLMTLIGIALSGCSKAPQATAPESADQNAAGTSLELSPPELRIIATGANISGANGLHFGSDGLLYVASVIGSELLALNPETGAVARRWTAEDLVFGPDDIAFNADGDYYWTSILTGEVAGFKASGERVVAANLGPGVNPITFSDDGRLFVAQCFFDTGLYEVDPDGIEPPRSIRDDLGPGCGLNGMDWGPDGRLYGPRWFQGSVVSIDVDSGQMREEAKGLQVPAAVKFDSQGQLYVLDTAAGAVLKISDGELESVASLVPGLDNFAFDDNDTLYVSSFADGFVARIDNGKLTELSPGGMSHPGGLTMHQGQVVVADFHSIRGFQPNTGAETFVQRSILGVSPQGSVVALADDGDHLILTSWMDNSVRIWDPVNERIIARYEELPLPIQAIRYNEHIAVTLHGDGSVALIDSDGVVSTLADGFGAPTGLVIQGDRLLVTDRSAGSVSAISPQGQVSVVATGLDAPEGIAVIAEQIFVLEGENGLIKEVSGADSRVIAKLAGGGTPPASPTQPPSMILNGLTADGSTLYATDERQRTLAAVDL